MNTDTVLATAARILAPYLGETMARASTRAHSEKLGITGGQMTPQQAEQFLENVARGMNIFVGRDKTAAIMGELRRALALPEGK